VLLVALAFIALFSPVTTFYFIPFTQNFATISIFGFNPTKIGVLVWAVVLFFKIPKLNFKGAQCLLILAPFLLWRAVVGREFAFTGFDENYFKAVLYALITCQAVNESKGQYFKLLIGLSLGCMTIFFPFILSSMGLPIQLHSAGGAREGIARIGSVAQDAIGIIWFSSLLSLSTILGVYITYNIYRFENFLTRFKSLITIFMILVILPVISSLMSFGAIAVFILLLCVYLFSLIVLKERKLFAKIVVSLCVVLIAVILFTDVDDKLKGLSTYYLKNVEQGYYLGTRTQGWAHSIESILQHPVLGHKFYSLMDMSEKNYNLDYPAHNIFLDVAKLYGCFGLLLYLLFFFFPVFLMLKAKNFLLLYPFFQNYMMFFLFFFILPFPFYKVFWAFWMFSCIVGLRMKSFHPDYHTKYSRLRAVE
jgi:O-antigen ligase